MNKLEKAFHWIFADKDDSFSVRKFLAILTGIVFSIAIIQYVFTHAPIVDDVGEVVYGGKDLPSSYVAIIAGVFLFYFIKEVANKLKLSSK